MNKPTNEFTTIDPFIHDFGYEAQDKITGFKGIIVARAQHIFGCNTYGLTPRIGESKKREETEWFDEGRIEIIGKGVRPKDVKVKKGGSDIREHPSDTRETVFSGRRD